MPFLVNNVIVHGEILDQTINLLGGDRTIPIFGNTLSIGGGGRKFSGSLTEHLHVIFCSAFTDGLSGALKASLRRGFNLNTDLPISFRITNIHLSTAIPAKIETLVPEILPQISQEFGIKNSEAEELANVNTPLPWHKIVPNVRRFRSLKVELINPPAHLKFQPSKNRNHTHCSLILPGFSRETNNFVNSLESICGLSA